MQAYVKTNTDKAAVATASAVTVSDAHTNGTARTITETMVETVLALAWANGRHPFAGHPERLSRSASSPPSPAMLPAWRRMTQGA